MDDDDYDDLINYKREGRVFRELRMGYELISTYKMYRMTCSICKLTPKK